jgi:RHS repeat-associated protein
MCSLHFTIFQLKIQIKEKTAIFEGVKKKMGCPKLAYRLEKSTLLKCVWKSHEQSKTRVSLQDYGARFYDPQIGRFHTIDILADTFSYQTPYAYAVNNPIKFIEVFGLGPGDLFASKQDAAKDWGRTYNGASIMQKTEYASTLYTVTANGKASYTYTDPSHTSAHGANPSPAPTGSNSEGFIHSHGNDDVGYDDNNFSGIPGRNGNPSGPNTSSTKGDLGYANKTNQTAYVTTPDGTLQEYEPSTGNITVVSTDMPSDPNDGSPTDNPLVPVEVKPYVPNDFQY